MQVIEAATANGPETLGPQAPKIGQLRKGYDADVIALARNPLRDLRVLANPGNVQMVWKSGQILKPMDLAYKGLAGKGGRAWAMWSRYWSHGRPSCGRLPPLAWQLSVAHWALLS